MLSTVRRWKYQALALCSALLVVACSGGEVTQPNASDPTAGNTPVNAEMNLYSSRHYDTDRALYDNFTAETGIKVNLIEADGDELIERVKSEGENSPADVILTVDAGRLWRAQEAGIFQPIQSEILTKAIPANFRQADGLWFGFSSRARVIVYNKDKVDPSELSTYEALTDPKWKGRIAIRSSSNMYNQSMVASMIDADGLDATEAWAKGLVANFAREPEGNDTDQISAVADGIADIAIVNSYYVARLVNSDDPADQEVASKIGMFFPNQEDRGTHINISGGGVAAHAPHRDNAIAFLEYLASPEAQALFADGNNEFPVVEGTPLNNEYLKEFVDRKVDPVHAEIIGKNNAAALQLMDRAGWR
ncbi:MAG: Fe(3+) ABC transporter substrate-binding protein [Oscillatoriales cyanobacterium]|nr:MAG: Fe(3+) ABC transporter substrate-binding protein [Oscillatoriales cyanobacterium]